MAPSTGRRSHGRCPLPRVRCLEVLSVNGPAMAQSMVDERGAAAEGSSAGREAVVVLPRRGRRGPLLSGGIGGAVRGEASAGRSGRRRRGDDGVSSPTGVGSRCTARWSTTRRMGEAVPGGCFRTGAGSPVRGARPMRRSAWEVRFRRAERVAHARSAFPLSEACGFPPRQSASSRVRRRFGRAAALVHHTCCIVRRRVPDRAGQNPPNRCTVKVPGVLRTPAFMRVSFPAITRNRAADGQPGGRSAP